MIDLDVRDDAGAVAREAANRFVSIVADAVEHRGIARVALSGGSTPKAVYPLLLEPARRDAIDWSAVEFFWGDERAVPPDHPESNFGVAYGMLISQLPGVRADRIHRMQAEAPDLDAAAIAYEAELRLAFDARGDAPPAFDLVWLGMGPDGHTASLFPGTAALDETERWVVANWVPSRDAWRMTLTFPVLERGARDPVRRDRRGQGRCAGAGPLRRRRSCPRPGSSGAAVRWIVDAAAARPGGLTRCPRSPGWSWPIVAGVAAYLVAWPAWQAYRAREARDTNTERYLAWRGRAPRGQASVREGMTGEERRRIYGGAALGVLAVVALIAFFATS